MRIPKEKHHDDTECDKGRKKLFVILILGITLLQSGCNKATKETQQKAEKADGVEEKKN